MIKLKLRRQLRELNKELKALHKNPVLDIVAQQTPLPSLENALAIIDLILADIDKKLVKAYPKQIKE